MADISDELPAGTRLNNDYVIEKVLGRGAFGVTYLATDNLDRKVAIKEYLPTDFASRDQQYTVHPKTGAMGDTFRSYLEKFLDEAKTIARFDHPNIVNILNFFEENKTAYIVMKYEVGEDLEHYFEHHPFPSEQFLLDIFIPMNEGLIAMHEFGCIHRDIKPANIFIREKDGSPVLLDFGAARDINAQRVTQFTTILTLSYAPFEQEKPKWKDQGPWTDIYALGATLYFAVTGSFAASSRDRAADIFMMKREDPYQSCMPLANDKYSEEFLAAIDHAMAFKPEDRPQDIDTWNEELTAGLRRKALEARQEQTKATQATTSQQQGATLNPDALDIPYPKSTIIPNGDTVREPYSPTAIQPQATSQKPVATEEKPSSKLLLIISVLGGILIAGGSMAAYLYFSLPPTLEVVKTEPDESEPELEIEPEPEPEFESAENKMQEKIIKTMVENTLLRGKTAGYLYAKVQSRSKTIERYQQLPADSGRTAMIMTLKQKQADEQKGFRRNIQQYINGIKELQDYPLEQVREGIDIQLDEQYAGDSAYSAIADLLKQHIQEDAESDDEQWQEDFWQLTQQAGVFSK